MLPIPFGNPYTYPGHSGVDFPQPRGTAFRASGPGRVLSIDYAPRPGHTVWVRYDDGPLVGYAHMDSRTTDVRVGDRVVEGTVLGRVGSLGTNSTGPHLHVEISGAASTAGFWRHFTSSRVVNAAGLSSSVSVPAPIARILTKGTDMEFAVQATSPSSDGLIQTGRTFAVSANAPMTIMAADEVAALDWFEGKDGAKPDKLIGYRLHKWDGDRIRALMGTRGYFPWSPGDGRTDYSQIKN